MVHISARALETTTGVRSSNALYCSIMDGILNLTKVAQIVQCVAYNRQLVFDSLRLHVKAGPPALSRSRPEDVTSPPL